ncbi:MAG: InlB B-repeat-containing protein [Candidatus Bathyarchaeota archaeon]|nr:InlB B-repeat-containing protein [Candidatus Termitimicrobium sp.]
MKNKSINKLFLFALSVLLLLALMPVITLPTQAAENTPPLEITNLSTVTEETIILEQNFNGLTDLPEGWTIHHGDWRISDGKLYQSYKPADMFDDLEPAMLTFNAGYLENFRFEANLWFEDYLVYYSWMGIGFDMHTPYPSPLTCSAFYWQTTHSSGAGFYDYPTWFPYPNFGHPSGPAPKDMSDGLSVHVMIEVYGEYGDIYFDGTLVVANAEIPRWGNDGSFGLIMGFGAVGSYDDIKITALPYRLPSITTDNLLSGTVDLPYVQKLVSEGDKITWSKISGDIPDGLTLSSNGVIAGTPTTSGLFIFTIKAENAKDESIKDFSITINTEYVSSFAGRGTDFSSGDIEIVSTSKIPESPKTFEAWVKIPITSSTIGVIAGNGAIDGFGLAVINFGVTSDGNPWLYWKETNGNEANYTAYANVKLGDWVHVAIVQDSENHMLICYVNGVKADEQTFSIMDNTIPIRPLKIGGDYMWANPRCFFGELADIRIWSIVRTASEIQLNMNTQLAGNEEGLMANWLLDGVVGSVYEDNSVVGNDARAWSEWLAPEFAVGDYTIAVIPDIQYLTLYYPDVLEELLDWILNSAQEGNIHFMIQVGDLTEKNTVIEWQIVQDNFAKLDGVVPYIFVPGNHDYAGMPYLRDTMLFNEYLLFSKYSSFPIFGGAYEDNKLDNAYYYFTTDDATYLMLCLDFVPRDPVLEWANDVVEANLDCRVIVVTHSYLSYDGSYDDSSGYDTAGNNGQNVWNKLVSQHANIIMVLCGHIHNDDLVLRVDRGIYGNVVPQLLVDAQDMDYYNKGVGMVALLTFSNNGYDVAVNWYSVKEDKLFRDWNQFTFSVELGTHTITFDIQDGTDLPAQTIEHGRLLVEPSDPTRLGYTFAGWFYGENKFDLNTPITSDITLIAKWEKIKLTIDSATPTASVKQLTGNKNDLTITITEKLSDGTTNNISQTFSINNNAANTYTVGSYRVYVDTKGNTQIRDCRIV